MARILARLALLVLCLSWALPAESSCAFGAPLCQTWRNNAAIFDATVRSVERIDRVEEWGGKKEKVGHRLVTFDVHESWLGGVGERLTVVLWGGYGVWRSESFSVEVGRRYLVFASRDEHGELTVSGCSGSREYSTAGDDLAFLRSLRKPAAGARIFGEVSLFDQTTTVGSSKRVPVKASVRISGPEYSKTISTERTFEVTGLKPGSYVIEVDGPPHLEREEPVLAVLPDAHACHSVDFYFRHRTRISGRVLDPAGKPLASRSVEAADAATWREDPISPITTYTDESGAFVFDGLTPGTYIIGVNLRDTLSSFRSEARVLYPTSDAPQPVRIDSGQQIEIGTLRLGPPLREIPMVLRLTWEDGAPVANQSVRIEDVTGGYSPKRQRIAAFARSDATGAIKVNGHATRTYIATLWVPERGTAIEAGRSAQFGAEAATRGLVLVMTPAPRR